MNEREFLQKYNISPAEFKNVGLDYAELTDIRNDYSAQFQKFDDAGADLVRTLLRFPSVHSIKYRIKDPEHLIAKIVRKLLLNHKLRINFKNYQDKIHDLIGIRILHLFKADWKSIHEDLTANFKIFGRPEANVRKGDLRDFIKFYKEYGCKIKNHPAGYRSVHYLLKNEAAKEPMICEVQVRTIFEEAWSEIDHKIRYPYLIDNETINQYLAIFNRLAASADEMAVFIDHLKNVAILNAQKLLELEKQIQKSSLGETEKMDIEKRLEAIVLSSLRNVGPETFNLKKPVKGLFDPELLAAIERFKLNKG